MARAKSLLRASVGGGAADELPYDDGAHREVPERHHRTREAREFHTSSGATVELLEGSLALQPDDDQLAGHDQHEAVAPFIAAAPSGRRFAAWSLRYLLVLAALDALFGGVAGAVTASMIDTLYAYQAVPLICTIGLIFWPIAISLSRGYRRARIGVGSDEFRAVLVAGTVIVAACAVPAGLVVVRSEASNLAASPLFALLGVVVVGAPLVVVLSLVARLFARKLLYGLQKQGRAIRRVIVAGSSVSTQQLIERIRRAPHGGMSVIGLCLPPEELPRAVVGDIPVLGNLDEVAGVAGAFGADVVAVTSDDATRNTYLRQLAWALDGSGVELLVDPGLEEVAEARLHIRPLIESPLVRIAEPRSNGWRCALKRVGEVVITSVGIILSAPILLGIAAVVKLQDGGPVIFRQSRVGRGGQLFTMLKFRSMVVDAEARKIDLLALNEGHGVLFKLRDDPRITPVGRFLRAFSLDELPQLFNVLRGSMSLVGPRPHLAHEVAQMRPEAQRRSLVRPGLTGLWQVSGRSDLEEDDAIRLDLRYVDNWSLTNDLQILCKTASAVLARRGAR